MEEAQTESSASLRVTLGSAHGHYGTHPQPHRRRRAASAARSFELSCADRSPGRPASLRANREGGRRAGAQWALRERAAAPQKGTRHEPATAALGAPKAGGCDAPAPAAASRLATRQRRGYGGAAAPPKANAHGGCDAPALAGAAEYGRATTAAPGRRPEHSKSKGAGGAGGESGRLG